jgi:D-sedoheptulose 7-phosphate isomerase
MEMTAYQKKQVKILIDILAGLNDHDYEKIDTLSDRILEVFANGGKLAIFGNGGSAAEASHIATEFLSKCLVDHEPLPVLCLNESTTFLSASANDYGFENTFVRLVRAYLKPNDILIGLSTSGKSKNILKGLAAANEIGCYTILWTGETRSTFGCNEIWHVKSNITPRIQEVHLFWGHQLAEITEKKL